MQGQLFDKFGWNGSAGTTFLSWNGNKCSWYTSNDRLVQYWVDILYHTVCMSSVTYRYATYFVRTIGHIQFGSRLRWYLSVKDNIHNIMLYNISYINFYFLELLMAEWYEWQGMTISGYAHGWHGMTIFI